MSRMDQVTYGVPTLKALAAAVASVFDFLSYEGYS